MAINWYNSWLLYSMTAISISIFSVYLFLRQKYNYWSERGVPGPTPINSFMQTFGKLKSYVEIEWLRKYGNVYGVFYGNLPVLTVAAPELMKRILVKDFDAFTDRFRSPMKHPILRHNLGEANQRDWKRLRAVVSTTFTSAKMRRMYPLIYQCVDELMVTLGTGMSADVDLRPVFGNLAMDVLATCAFSIKCGAQAARDVDSEFVAMAKRAFNPDVMRESVLQTALNWVGVGRRLDASAHEFFFGLIRGLIADRKRNTSRKYNDFLQILMDAVHDTDDDMDPNESYLESGGPSVQTFSKHITDDELVANGWLWFASGTETITIALSFAVYELALNPGAQWKLYAEIAAALDTDGRIDYDSVARLPYLEAVFAETLRLHAPLHRIARYANRDYALGDDGTGIVVKSGQKVEVPAYAIHHMEEHFENPDEFNPDRFLPANRTNIAPYTYVPFGVGPRYCVAMNFATLEVKLTLATLVSRYEFVRSPNTDVPPLLRDMIEIHSPKRMVLSVIKRQ